VGSPNQSSLLRAVHYPEGATYVGSPIKDAMNLTVQFSRLPKGTNHVSNLVINGVSKQLSVAIQNSNYQHL
jgi:hypothetical protein